MKKILILCVALLFCSLQIANAQQSKPKNDPLQPANQPEIFDFSLELNDPDSEQVPIPYTEPQEEDDGELAEPELTNEEVVPIIDSNVESRGISNSTMIWMFIVVVIVSAGISAAYYIYKTRKTTPHDS